MIKHYTDYSIKSHHTFGMDVKAKHFIEYDSVEDLLIVLSKLRNEGSETTWMHIGSGSNLLFLALEYEGTILHSNIKDYSIVDENESNIFLRVGSGVVWDELVEYVVAQGWGGMENLSLIPGEVGSSAVQNIGAYGVEVKDLIVSVEAIDVSLLTERTFSVEECKYAYRQSAFKNELKGKFVVTHVTYRLEKNPHFNLEYGNIQKEIDVIGRGTSLDTIRQAIINIRNAKLPDPRVLGNAGSFFMNPIVPREIYDKINRDYPQMPYYKVDDNFIKIPAGWMIEQCGWKGRSLGRAAVHDKQALVLVNLGGATGEEMETLCKAIQEDVFRRFGVTIHPEVNFIK